MSASADEYDDTFVSAGLAEFVQRQLAKARAERDGQALDGQALDGQALDGQVLDGQALDGQANDE